MSIVLVVGRASKHGIRVSEVQSLIQTRNIFFVLCSQQDNKHLSVHVRNNRRPGCLGGHVVWSDYKQDLTFSVKMSKAFLKSCSNCKVNFECKLIYTSIPITGKLQNGWGFM